MRELSVVHQPAPMDAVVVITAKLTVRGGKETWLCNPFSELTEAMDAGETFTAHEIIGMKPNPIIVNPANVATIAKAH